MKIRILILLLVTSCLAFAQEPEAKIPSEKKDSFPPEMVGTWISVAQVRSTTVPEKLPKDNNNWNHLRLSSLTLNKDGTTAESRWKWNGERVYDVNNLKVYSELNRKNIEGTDYLVVAWSPKYHNPKDKKATSQTYFFLRKWHDPIEKVKEWEKVSDIKLKGPQKNVWTNETDRAVKMWLSEKEWNFVGITSDRKPQGETAFASVKGDDRELVSVSCDFKLTKDEGEFNVTLGGMTECSRSRGYRSSAMPKLAMYYRNQSGKGMYFAQSGWVGMRRALKVGQYNTTAVGDNKFHNMRVILDRKNLLVSYYVDNKVFCLMKIEKYIWPVCDILAAISTHKSGVAVDTTIKNIELRVSGESMERLLTD